MATFLLAFGALFSIVNPLSGAFIFFGATLELEPKVRSAVSRWVSIYAFCIVAASLYIGAYVLIFFGISIPVLRVAGGIIVAMSGWRMLTEPDATEQRRSETPRPWSVDVPPSRLAFYPLTMPQERYNAEWVSETRAGIVLDSFKDIRAGVDEVIARLPELRARVARIENRAIFEIPEILDRLLHADRPAAAHFRDLPRARGLAEPHRQTGAPIR